MQTGFTGGRDSSRLRVIGLALRPRLQRLRRIESWRGIRCQVRGNRPWFSLPAIAFSLLRLCKIGPPASRQSCETLLALVDVTHSVNGVQWKNSLAAEKAFQPEAFRIDKTTGLQQPLARESDSYVPYEKMARSPSLKRKRTPMPYRISERCASSIEVNHHPSPPQKPTKLDRLMCS